MDYNRNVAMIYTSKSKLFVSKGGTLRVTTGQMSGVMTANKKKCIYTHIYLHKPRPCSSAGNVSPLLAWSATKIDLAAPKISCSDFKQRRKQTERYIFQEANKGRGVTQEENGTVQYTLQSPP